MVKRKMKTAALFGAVAIGCMARGAGLPSAEAFADPGADSRPETWFHFIGGNVARGGITADLEAIKGAGISGIHLFHGQFGGKWPGVEEQIRCLSEKWDSLVGFVADECRRLGLEFTMQNCPGWAMAGGPWIKPENAMRHLKWLRQDFEGGRRIETKLRCPESGKEAWRDYRDVAVLAFPAPVGEWYKPLVPARTKCAIPGDWNKWAGGGNAIKLPSGEQTTVIEFEYDRPVTVRAMELPPIDSLDHGWCYRPGVNVKLEANGKTLVEQDLQPANWQDDRHVSFAIDETVAKNFKITLKTKHSVRLGTIRLFEGAKSDDWEGQAGWTLRRLMRNPPRKQNAKAWVEPNEVIDVSAFMKPDGTFSWEAPAGRWAIVRVGHVNTGRRNAPAPAEATGFECDKLSTKGADAHFAGYIGRIAGKGGPAEGKLRMMLMDSWECKRQTWTEGLDKTFEEEMGYKLLPWMPAIFGYVVRDPGTTEKFLDDWRGFIGRQISYKFYGRMAKLCRDAGLKLTFETSFADVLPGDMMEYYKFADVPMCEFWQPTGASYVGSRDFKAVKPTVSAAHIYGKNRVAAEALTSFTLTWDEKLRDLKHVANIHMVEGVSHLVFHTYTHNPRTDFLPPGTSFGAHIGTPFLRGQTWWKHMPGFTAYLARCQQMLEAGVPARDVLWYVGDEWDQRPDQDAPFPAGHLYDYCNPDALLSRFDIAPDGTWRTPEGAAYKVLWVPECRRMLPETMEKILDCLAKGGTAAFAKLPSGIATLKGGEKAVERFRAALAKMERRAADTASGVIPRGKGRLYLGLPLAEVLGKEYVSRDASADGILFDHRKDGAKDWYFVVPAAQGRGFKGEVWFRNVSEGVEIWNPQTGERKPAQAKRADGWCTVVSLDLAPGEAAFVVFSKDGMKPVRPKKTKEVAAFAPGPWKVAFAEGWGMPASVELAALKPWKDIGETAEAKAYCGSAVYASTFVLPAVKKDAAAGYVLDLGRVESLAKVKVNGREFPALWSQPYRVDITSAVKEGANTLEIEVTDTWYNRLAYDAGRPAAERRTWTISGPRKGSAMRDSGLLGPVKVVETKTVDARPVPNPALARRLAEGPDLVSIVHWGPTTYTDKEWGYGNVSPSLINPGRFDADQIVGACKGGGIGGIVLVCKHHDGFCLWPTKTTDYNISATPFRGGKGDYVKEIEQACRRAGLKFGVYVSPWDRNNVHYGTEKYVDVFHGQIKELLDGRYGKIFEMWFDGANGGSGWYGGKQGTRRIGANYYRFDDVMRFVREMQPGVTIFGSEEDISDFRWPGNERGFLVDEARATVVPVGGFSNGRPHNPGYSRQMNSGTPGGDFFRPSEADFPLRPGWVYHKSQDGRSKNSAFLTLRYLQSVGNGGTMNIGVSPNLDGRVSDEDVRALRGFKVMREALFAREAKDGEPFNVVVLAEDLANGEQVDGWELLADGRNILGGTAIGRRRIRLLDAPVSAKKVELRITADGGDLLPVSVRRYHADPELVKTVKTARADAGETDTAKWMKAGKGLD